MYESDCLWGGGGGQSFFYPPSKTLLGHSYEILIILSDYLAQAQSIATLFELIGLRGGHVQKSEARARVQAAGRVKPMKQQYTPN